MKRGDVYDARLDPTEGSEQAGTRPMVIVSRDAINSASPVVVIVPLTNAVHLKRLYPHTVALPAGDGGLTVDSVALAGQVRAISKTRLIRFRGHLSDDATARINKALQIALDL